MTLWLPVPGFPDYLASHEGKIIGPSDKILVASNNGHGYWKVNLCKGNKPYQRYVHRIIALTFLGEPKEGEEVNHKDGNTSNNHVDNLEWVTKHENALHSYRKLKRPHPQQDKRGPLSKNSEKWIVIDPFGKEMEITGLLDFCKAQGLTPSAMYNTAYGKRNHHKNWRCRRV